MVLVPRVARWHALFLLVPLVALAFATPARALPIGEVTDMLAEDSASVLALFGFSRPTLPTQTIQFTSNVTSTSFSYTTAPLQLYDGQLLTLTGNGSYDGVSQWTMNSVGTYGALAVTTTATQTRSTLPSGGILIQSDYDYYENGIKQRDLHIDLAIFPPIPGDPVWRSYDEAYFTDQSGSPIPGAQYVSWDVFNEDTGNWDIEIKPLFPQPPRDVYVSISGNSPIAGGAGTFTASISAVPEPSSLALAASALFVGAGIAIRRTRHARSERSA